MRARAAPLVAYSYQSMAKGSLSFTFASQIFQAEVRERVVKLYAWCRYVDNQVDELPASADGEERQRLLQRLERESFAPLSELDQELPPAMQAFRSLRSEVAFPEEYARDLIEGMAMDLSGLRYETEAQLYLYCYRVAGVVGLMMSQLMRVSSEVAYLHASDLGIAMQLTNICRDIGDDAALGRTYLPRAWLQEAGFAADESLLHPERRPQLLAVVTRTLDLADRYYQSGDAGLKYLPLRCALAIAVAREVYAGIGLEIRARGAAAWQERVWLRKRRKLRLALRGLGRVLQTLPYRWRRLLSPSSTYSNERVHYE